MKIFIDAGHNHSGDDTGAQGNGLKEQDVTYQIAQKIGSRLKDVGVGVKCSREHITDNIGVTVSQSINGRVKMANDWKADLFVSIHCNAYANSAASGTETLVYSNKGTAYQLAQIVNANLASLGLNDRGVKIRTDLGVLRNTSMPAILIEVAFISNILDADILRNRQDDIAGAIATSIFKFLEIEVNSMFETAQQAIDYLTDKGIINSPDYWLKACDVVKNLDLLFVKIANSIK